MKTTQFFLGLLALTTVSLNAISQETEINPLDTLARNVSQLNDEIYKLKKLNISGYVQGQFQYCDSNGVNSYNGGKFEPGQDKRIILRRARLKFTYATTLSKYVFNFDATEKGFAIKDMYMQLKLPILKNIFSITVGNQNRPFGFEIPYSSSLRESPERGRMSQIIFPGERDMGAMLTIQAPKGSALNIFKIDAALFNGTSSGNIDFDKHKDVISRLSFKKSTTNEKINVSGGISYYAGAWQQATNKVYSIGVNAKDYNAYMVDTTSHKIGDFAKQTYFGGDLQCNFITDLGLTSIRVYYIQGEQASEKTKTDSPKTKPTGDVYTRDFNGGYFYLVQNIGQTKHQFALKYDKYDPNTKVAGKIIGDKNTNLTAADIMYSTIGIGYAYKFDENVKFSLYYDMVKNETTSLKGYTHDVPDNIVTLRMQYKF